MDLITTDKQYCVVGLGKTGYSAAQYLANKGHTVVVMDTRESPPHLQEIRQEFPEMEILLGGLDTAKLVAADEIILSPGVPLATPQIAKAVRKGVPVIGDVDLFLRENEQREQPSEIIAITGSNGKSTVTLLVGQMLAFDEKAVAVGGNIGTPALELIEQVQADVTVLELSSFQLETMKELRHHIATVLNVSEDHMDRYETFLDYYRAKHKIFHGAKVAVVNFDDPLTQPLINTNVQVKTYSTKQKDLHRYSLGLHEDQTLWIWKGMDPWMSTKELALRGKHNYSNALVALSLAEAVNCSEPAMRQALKEFRGLPHRCEFVRTLDGVEYINDSKGTNVGSTQAALVGLGNEDQANIVLIAGGVGKDANFRLLAPEVEKYCKHLVLIGEDADEMAEQLNFAQTSRSDTLAAAIDQARNQCAAGDLVLLSPACASFDMFKSFEHRGDVFKQLVGDLR